MMILCGTCVAVGYAIYGFLAIGTVALGVFAANYTMSDLTDKATPTT